MLGGSRDYLLKHTGRDIHSIKVPLHSMDEMHAWNAENLGQIFDSDVSKEYLRLFQSGCLSAEELDDIRRNGLRQI